MYLIPFCVFSTLLLMPSFKSLDHGFENMLFAWSFKDVFKRNLCLTEFNSSFRDELHIQSALNDSNTKACCYYAQLKECLDRNVLKPCLSHQSTSNMLVKYEKNISTECSSLSYTVINFSRHLIKYLLI